LLAQNHQPQPASGGQIGLIAPAAALIAKVFWPAVNACARWDTNRSIRRIFLTATFILPGRGARAHEFQEFWRRDDIAALVCVRGGMAAITCWRVDYRVIAARPKILLDAVMSPLYLQQSTIAPALIGFHGPMAAKDIADGTFDLSSWKNALQGGGELERPDRRRGSAAQRQRLGPSVWRMPLHAVASLGTQFEIQTDGCILL